MQKYSKLTYAAESQEDGVVCRDMGGTPRVCLFLNLSCDHQKCGYYHCEKSPSSFLLVCVLFCVYENFT